MRAARDVDAAVADAAGHRWRRAGAGGTADAAPSRDRREPVAVCQRPRGRAWTGAARVRGAGAPPADGRSVPDGTRLRDRRDDDLSMERVGRQASATAGGRRGAPIETNSRLIDGLIEPRA